MIQRLLEILLPRIIGFMTRQKELTKTEAEVQTRLLERLSVPKRKTRKPTVVGMIGLVGSGKSPVAKELSRHIGGVVISSDEIRIALRKADESYNHTWLIARNIATEIIKRGGNAIMDSDFVDQKKRADLRDAARLAGVKVVFVRTRMDFDNMLGLAMMDRYKDSLDDFFGGASTTLNTNSVQVKGAVVKIREMMRRVPLHYRWENKGVGRWVLKAPPCPLWADIDITNDKWKGEIERCVHRLI